MLCICLGGVIVGKIYTLIHRENKVRYTIKEQRLLLEENLYSNCYRIYVLNDMQERMVFQTHLKHFSKYYMDVIIDTKDLYYLHKIGWL